MAARKEGVPCVVCNPERAEPGDYCSVHREELHRLDHQYESLFRLSRTARGKDHETYDPCGRVVVTETDPENLYLTVLLAADLDLDARISEFGRLGVVRTYGDQLRQRIEREIVHSWYGNARACVDVFRTSREGPLHWDFDPREGEGTEENPDLEPPDEAGHLVH